MPRRRLSLFLSLTLAFGLAVPTTSPVAMNDETSSARAAKVLPIILSVILADDSGPVPGAPLSDLQVGRDLQVLRSVNLPSAPSNPVDVVVTVASGGGVTLSTAARAGGTNSVIFSGVTGTFAGNLHVQGRTLGAVTVRVQAAGYADQLANVTVVPSGFYLGTSSVVTQVSGAARPVPVYSAALNPGNLVVAERQSLRGGLAVNVQTNNTSPTVGTFTNPIRFSSNQGQAGGTFAPSSPGTTTLSLTQPTGFSAPSDQLPAIPATVGTTVAGNRAQFLFDCNLNGLPAVLLMNVELVSETGIVWGSGPDPDITAVIGTGTFSTLTTGSLIYPTAQYGFNGRNRFADFFLINGSERFRVEWIVLPNGIRMVINPFGPGPTTQDCDFTGFALL